MEHLFQKIKQDSLLVLLLLTGAVFLFLRYLVPLLAPIILAMLFLAIFGPLLQKMQGMHIHRQLGAGILLLVAFAALVGVILLLAGWIWNGLPDFFGSVDEWKELLPDFADGWIDIAVRELKKGTLGVEKGLLSGALLYTGKLAALGGGFITFLIAVILLAKDYDELMNELLNREDCHLLLSVICGIIRYIATFVKAQVVIMTVIAALCALTLTLIGIPQGVLWGMLAGLLDALPFIGTGVVLTPLAIYQLLRGRIWGAVLCGILYVSCILVREMMEPKLIGKRMGVRPIAILISLYVGIKLFGVAGIIKGPLGFVMIWEAWQHLKHGAKA